MMFPKGKKKKVTLVTWANDYEHVLKKSDRADYLNFIVVRNINSA